MEYNSAIKNDKLETFITKWMDLKTIHTFKCNKLDSHV